MRRQGVSPLQGSISVNLPTKQVSGTDTAGVTVPRFTALCRYCVSYKLKAMATWCLQFYCHDFPNCICSLCVPVSYFGDSCKYFKLSHYYIYYDDLSSGITTRQNLR